MLSIVEARSVDLVLKQVVEGVAAQSNAALVRIWLVGKGDLCPDCRLREKCFDHSSCLHLAASAGGSLAGDQAYSRLDGGFRRVPMEGFKIGQIAATGRALLAPNVTGNEPWAANPKWIKCQGVKSFAGLPLVFHGGTLGVLAVFERAPLVDSDFEWLRLFADHAAVAIANARAFEEIDRLRSRLERENAYLQEEVKEALKFGEIVGSSPPLRKALGQIELVARTDASVLILGESGVGKELVARAIHERSDRRNRPLIKVNCGAIPETLFESEMFGHIKGAFTGAVKDRAGRFELADGGTLFLDEVGEIPLALQAKLLRVLQEQQFERVGEERSRHINTRIVAATNRPLKEEVEAGRFRADLYYRLSVFPIEVPPLRDRREDIPLLAAHLVKVAAKKMNLPPPRIEREQIDLLRAYDWPGNVRELQNAVERAVILAQNGPLRFDLVLPATPTQSDGEGKPSPPPAGTSGVTTRAALKERERESIRAALQQTNGKIFGPRGAAELLGMKGTTLASRIKALGIKNG
jgi:transcriptional regulator with GAF, ATPase, and Fis domain